MFQRHAVQKLHDDEWTPIVLANFVNGADVGMVEGRGGLAFALEAAERLRVVRHIVGQEFQGDKAAKVGSSAL